VVPDEFTSRPRVSLGRERALGSAKGKPCRASDLGQIALPADPDETDNNQVQPRAQQEAPPRPISGLSLGRRSPPRPTPGLGLNLGLGKSHILTRPWASALASASEEPPPRPTLSSDRPRRKGYIITLLLASSGYEGTRPASHQAYPGNRQ
jgi:hypothetical protein